MAFFFLLVSIWAVLWLVSRFAFRQQLASHAKKGRIAAAIAFTLIGISHLASPEKLAYMIADWLPYAHEMVILSGIAEMAGGIGLLLPRFRRLAAMGLIILLVVIFPANINVAINQLPAPGGLPASPWYTWSRLLFQPMYIAWIWWSCLRKETN
ncbi:DoxX family protein [Larkinella terrae]|uniref:DoxX family membrane protein n=1 Tax=Larkinella terrae TaxID=2025311 RepID=A0A7K0EKB2_9BACT|nr:DoxX family membrane protein [Larkinella terrae]MRS61916.1 DoxX family membrane protein [Larkinella terrae]